MMDDSYKRIILMDHYSHARNRGLLEDPKYRLVHNASDSCIDDIKVQMSFDGDKIEDVRFDGIGCTISTASTSIISNLIKGKSREEALHIIDNYYRMLKEEDFDEDLLEEANAFDTLYKQPNRIKCGTIGIRAMEQLIRESYGKQE